MTPVYLKFTSESEAIEALADYRIVDPERGEMWHNASHEHALDAVGTIYAPTGALLVDAGGVEYPELAPLPGYHVNLMLSELPPALQPFAVTPATPSRVFAA